MLKTASNFINGFVLSSIAMSLGYNLDNWQWWAWVTFGTLYVYFYAKSQNYKSE